MAGHKNFRVLRAELEADPGRAALLQAHCEAARREQDAYERTLPELGKARADTQLRLAATLGITQSEVSRIERRAGIYLSTLQECVAALGGRLELTAAFGDDRLPISIGDIADLPADVTEWGGAGEHRGGVARSAPEAVPK
jgi:DNA-binding Xre family transcriptional regulator